MLHDNQIINFSHLVTIPLRSCDYYIIQYVYLHMNVSQITDVI